MSNDNVKDVYNASFYIIKVKKKGCGGYIPLIPYLNYDTDWG